MATDPELLAAAIMVRTKEQFLKALYQAVKGDPSPLARIMRARPLTMTQQRIVANLLEGKFKRSRGNPGGKVETKILREAAKDVIWLKGLIRESGIRSRVHKIAMPIVLDMYGKHAPDEDKLENYLARSKQPRPKKSRT